MSKKCLRYFFEDYRNDLCLWHGHNVPAKKALRRKAFRHHRACRWRRVEAFGAAAPNPKEFFYRLKPPLFAEAFY